MLDEYFSMKINENGELHKFLPPALGPKAVRHYAPTMQKTVEDAFKVFDELDERDEAWNVYPYMLKLGSQAVGKQEENWAIDFFVSETNTNPFQFKVGKITRYSSDKIRA